MRQADEIRLVTSDEFVADLVCELALRNVQTLTLADTLTDDRFQAAFDDLLSDMDSMNVEVDFSLAVNPYHGDSSTLRETLYDLRERGVVAINNPSFKTVDIRVGKARAEHFLNRSSLPKEFIQRLVDKHFADEGALIDRRSEASAAD